MLLKDHTANDNRSGLRKEKEEENCRPTDESNVDS